MLPLEAIQGINPPVLRLEVEGRDLGAAVQAAVFKGSGHLSGDRLFQQG